uniref:Uncharacterized protein n=1 Tax=Nonomuraea gerenzanensis TaxID=93944 RepID=A0A1M4EKH8_9ACTN|nr:hypothetical protein BN4615_P8885 [Nonomuraea gerenzanensis]
MGSLVQNVRPKQLLGQDAGSGRLAARTHLRKFEYDADEDVLLAPVDRMRKDRYRCVSVALDMPRKTRLVPSSPGAHTSDPRDGGRLRRRLARRSDASQAG